jgi:hypothetical protein
VCLAVLYGINYTTVFNPMTALSIMNARETIFSDYTKEERDGIANHGCVSGCAPTFIMTRDCLEFFTEHQEEIEDYLHDYFNDRDTCYMAYFGKNSSGIDDMQVNMVWAFVEGICNEDLD